MRKDDKDYLDEKLDNIFIKMGFEFNKFSSAVELKLRDVNAGMDITHLKMDQIIARQDVANHRVSKLESDTIRIPKNKRGKAAGIALVAVFTIGLVSATAFHVVDWAKTFKNKTNIEFKDEEITE